MEENNNATQIDEAKARKFRRMGYAILGGLALALSIVLAYAMVSGVNNDTAMDPYTGEVVK